MSFVPVSPAAGASQSIPWTRAALGRALWSGWAVSVPVVLLATVAVALGPHTRGIGFFLALRYALVTPACVLASLGAALLYRALLASGGGAAAGPRTTLAAGPGTTLAVALAAEPGTTLAVALASRPRRTLAVALAARPRTTLAVALAALALVVLVALALTGPRGLVAAALPAVVVVAVALAVLVPRRVERPRRSRLGTVAAVVVVVALGALEAAGVVVALAGERVAPPAAHGPAFAIPRALYDVEPRFVTLPSGARVHYVDEGQGQTLLFLHGNPAWSFQWRDLIAGLRGSYRCVALDYPGFGLSEAPAGFGFTPREQSRVVEEFVDRLGLDDVTLVMQDWGGPIGLGFAGRRPERVRRVILGSTWAWPSPPNIPRGIFSRIAGGPVGEFAQVNFNAFARFGIANGIVRPLPADVRDAYLRPFRPLAHRGIAAFYPGQILAAADYFAEVEAGLPRLADKPALIFWALRDPGVGRGDLARFEATFPQHQTIELPNANHFFFEDAAAQMIPAMRRFLEASRPSQR
jgi:haloalkane dehalogenase